MKRLEIVLFIGLVVIWSYAFAHASEIDCEIIHCEKIKQGESVRFAWDEVTKLVGGEDISASFPEDCEIEYIVHIEKNGDPALTWELEPDPRREVEISFAISPGKYYVGVKAAIYKDNRMVSQPSDISWSKFRNCTNNNPFVVEVESLSE